jgi:hypothetical protein
MHVMWDISFHALYCLETVPAEEAEGKVCLDVTAVDNMKSYVKEKRGRRRRREISALEENFKSAMHAMRDISFHALYCLETVPAEEAEGKVCLDVTAVDNVKSYVPNRVKERRKIRTFSIHHARISFHALYCLWKRSLRKRQKEKCA